MSGRTVRRDDLSVPAPFATGTSPGPEDVGADVVVALVVAVVIGVPRHRRRGRAPGGPVSVRGSPGGGSVLVSSC